MILFNCQPLGICIASSPSYANLTPSSVPPTLAQSVDSELVLERPSRLPMLSRPLILHDAPPSLRLLHRGMHLQLLPPKRSQEDLPHRCHVISGGLDSPDASMNNFLTTCCPGHRHCTSLVGTHNMLHQNPRRSQLCSYLDAISRCCWCSARILSQHWTTRHDA